MIEARKETVMLRRMLIVSAALVLAAGTAHAQRGPKGKCPGHPDCPRVAAQRDQSAAPPATATPAVRKAGEISYLTGGVGKPEREQLKALEKDFNLKLVFSEADGKFLANVRVVVSDAKGRKLLEDVADGPFFLARMPAGEYRVAATFAGKAQTRNIQVVAGRLHTEHLRWK
jgi:hypothetical protein